jgi:hypothetical protein
MTSRPSPVKPFATLAVIGAVLLSAPRLAHADTDAGAPSTPLVASADTPDESLLTLATRALASGDVRTSIDDLEALADRGVLDPASSFDRGLAYAGRVRAHAEIPGDLGQAVHGFEEARDLSVDPDLISESRRALGILREEIARRRARNGDSPLVDPGLPFGRALIEVASENTWALLALCASVTLALAIGMRARIAARRAQVAAVVVGVVSALLLVGGAILSVLARDQRLHLEEGIVISPSARPSDEKHAPLAGVAPIPEGARVELHEESQGFRRIRWSTFDVWLPSSALRPLAKRS